jgi:asparagine synthase (glutamine-hydrolysing)
MCGIAGYSLAKPEALSASVLLAMSRAIAHRGPDDEGLTFIGADFQAVHSFSTSDSARGVSLPVISPEASLPHRIALAHRRFAIIDLSVAGHQPFWTSDGRLGCAFNGEIYNYVELRDELAKSGVAFRTRSDTEVLLEAYRAWGERCFERFNGFWALALYDRERGEVLLARDRVGKAPLYVARCDGGLWWCSEIKGLRAGLGDGRFRVNDQAVLDYVRSAWRDVDNSTFYEGISTFPRASWAWVGEDGRWSPTTYWQIPRRRLTTRAIAIGEAAAGLRSRLEEAVRLRMRADVPVGFELSGGLDSSSLVSLAATRGFSLDAFTVAFPEPEANEEPFARQVAERYAAQVRYSVIEPPPGQFFERADRYVALLDEPFHSPNLETNQGTWRAMAARNIRVSFNGAAGDEVLAGYSHYLEPFLTHLFTRGHPGVFARELSLALEKLGDVSPGHTALVVTRAIALPMAAKVRARLPWRPSRNDPFQPPPGVARRPGPARELGGLLLDDMGDWHMNYWMRSSNTSCMGVPIELRFPFLDYKVVEFAFQLPLTYLIHDGWFKWILRKAVEDILPPDVAWRRRKLGFPFPLRAWLVENANRFWHAVRALDCPYISVKRLRDGYSRLSQDNPSYLWRLMSLALWWQRCIQGRSLA